LSRVRQLADRTLELLDRNECRQISEQQTKKHTEPTNAHLSLFVFDAVPLSTHDNKLNREIQSDIDMFLAGGRRGRSRTLLLSVE
jgi:hypothetical protein